MPNTKFSSTPFIEIKEEFPVYQGWDSIIKQLLLDARSVYTPTPVIAVEYYPGVLEEEVSEILITGIKPALVIQAKECMWPDYIIRAKEYKNVTDDRIFGHMTDLALGSFFNPELIEKAHDQILSVKEGIILVLGTGAAMIWPDLDFLVYADMARWEIQLRMRQHKVNSLGINNKDIDWELLYKQGYFVDWRVCDPWKKLLMPNWDYLLDTNNRQEPKMIDGTAFQTGIMTSLARPFSVVPFFDPGPWGGQWMKENCNLDPAKENYAWCFNCVPEENSVLFKFGDCFIEHPSIDILLYDAEHLLGADVYKRFGTEFPIRFDFLDTIGGGNLSLQVHPLKKYIRQQFGMSYTQDESYYLMDAKPGAQVYLGLKEGVNPDEMIADLEKAEAGEKPFDAEKHVQTWPAQKHDHFLIPAGTVHCSGKDAMVLEVSATPYIFTFKLWDWGRLGLDGRPRPINIKRGEKNIQWKRTTEWTRKNLVNRIKRVDEGDGWIEERTGLHKLEFIETRRHWFTKKVEHNTDDNVHVICLIEGSEVVVESPFDEFEPFVVHYAETFIVPAMVGYYTISPHGESEGKRCGTLKAYVRPR
ncbi:MAG: class I mannose-6-phosphate isomerase [Bacteroidales bacterium]|nr:class I mannose-6-phosphate isomerase [Bacteroidales bacterium]